MPGPISNFFMKSIVNSPLHFLLGSNIAVITVEGRKTGKSYSTPINVMKDGAVFTATSLRSRSWWRNVRGGRSAMLRVAGRRYAVHAELVENGDEVAIGLAQYFRQHPSYARPFGVRLAADGQPNTEDLRRVARERVIIRLAPTTGK